MDLTERYGRQILQLGEGQKRISLAHAAIVGVGAIGTNAAALLARAGIGKLTLIDRDIVEESNLSRQAIFTESDKGMPKAAAAQKRIQELRPDIEIIPRNEDLNRRNINLLDNADIILDCTDNLQTRFLINEHAKKNKKIWIHSSAIGWKGYVKVFDGDCFACLFDDSASPGTCEQVGVISTIPAAIASMQATEAIKVLAGKKYERRLIFYDGETNTLRAIKTGKKDGCEVCAGIYPLLSGEKEALPSKRCGNVWQITKKIDFSELKRKIKCEDYGDFLKAGGITLFSDGRALVKADSEKEARALYSKLIGD